MTTPRAGSDFDQDSQDSIELAPGRQHNPFGTPYGSMPVSAMGSSTGVQRMPPPRYFHSRRIRKGETERPWLEKKDPKEKWVTIIPLIGIFVGLALTGFMIYEGLQSIHSYTYCPVLMDDFSSGLSDKWYKEVEVGGFGNGQFEETTNTDENAYVQDGMLILKPTLQDQKLIETNNVINLLSDGSCSSTSWSDCVAVTNTTNGTIVNPVKSARISTQKSASIKFGRVEVEAKLPAGDWLWPAIWMLPVNNTYGPWPASGEIDIMESRGNNYTYPQGGDNIVSSTLHWGPDSDNDGWWQNNVKREALHTTYAAQFHTYGLEWNEKYLFTYIDSRLLQVVYVNFNKPFWQKGDFPAADTNGTRLVDPWNTGRDSTPFDQDFYLILNVAVGGTNGWFDDGVAGKPWVDASPTAKKEFWEARDQWYPTWQKNDQGQMQIKSVKMWQQAGYNGCSA
ncbi:glycoside hydrolase family 16 protein [Teratosphaeria nubilosa]|uniref:Glycoside hydrolase family 16 protein n=1 Tax=Teratosphaeria nubilosa TaxID=161662 RepID=A0A6G1LC56_9PEZI|nr:glycoside hydrolase family 16 protein [Teratosphaeria nubilosa]